MDIGYRIRLAVKFKESMGRVLLNFFLTARFMERRPTFALVVGVQLKSAEVERACKQKESKVWVSRQQTFRLEGPSQ